MSDLQRSWVEGANSADTDFPLNNLPYGVFSTVGAPPRCCVAIGQFVVDLAAVEAAGIIDFDGAFAAGDWCVFMARGRQEWQRLRAWLRSALEEGSDEVEALRPYLLGLSDVRMHLPFRVAEFTDFFSSRHHVSNVGAIHRGRDYRLPPNWSSMPLGYNGRASSVVVSGTDVVRPIGQVLPEGASSPRVAPSGRFDIELEIGAVVGIPSDRPLSVAEAFENIFGFVLLNDWSARDIQAWEARPLGPFQSKVTATTVGPWIVTKDALEPFRIRVPENETPLLDYLREPGPTLYDIDFEVALTPKDGTETVISRSNLAHMSFSPAQQLAHHTLCGCPMRCGDLLGSGTISGPEEGSWGSLLELSWGGTRPIALDGGKTRSFLEDGDCVSLRGAARGRGYRVGFGSCDGCVTPARPAPGGG